MSNTIRETQGKSKVAVKEDVSPSFRKLLYRYLGRFIVLAIILLSLQAISKILLDTDIGYSLSRAVGSNIAYGIPLFIIGAVPYVAAFLLLFFLYFFIFDLGNLKTEEEIANRKNKVAEKFQESPKTETSKTNYKPQDSSTSYFNSLVEINVENLEEYYVLVKTHTNNSYRVSLTAGVIGFMFIIIGLGIGLFGGADKQTLSYVSAASGIAAEFISGIFFYLYNKTVRQLKEYHDSLISVQNILLSFKIVENIKDGNQKAKMVNQMLAYIFDKQVILAKTESEKKNV